MKKKSIYYRIEDKQGQGYPTALGKLWGTAKWNSKIDKAEKTLDDDLVVPEGVKKTNKFAFTPSFVRSHRPAINNLISESSKIGVNLKVKKVTIPMNNITWGDKDQVTYKQTKSKNKKVR